MRRRAGVLLACSLALASCGDESVPRSVEVAESWDASWEDLAGSAWGVPHTVRVRGNSASYGGVTNDPSGVFRYSMAADPAGNPWIAGRFDDRVGVKRWNGAGWETLDAAMDTVWGNLLLATDPFGAVVVAGTHLVSPASVRIEVRRWRGSHWDRLSQSGPEDSASFSSHSRWRMDLHAVTLDSAGAPVLMWSDWNETLGKRAILAARWTGGSWIAYDPIWTNWAKKETAVAMALDRHGRPVIGWVDNLYTGGSTMEFGTLRVCRWNGIGWDDLAAGSGSALPYSLSVVVDGEGSPVVSCRSAGGVLVRRWTRGAWEDIGQGLSAEYAPTLLVEHDGSLTAALVDETGIQVRTWDERTRTWQTRAEEIRSGTVSGPVALACAAGKLLAVWKDSLSGVRQIYLKSWNGNGWEEFGAREFEGGISRSPEWSAHPSLAVNESGTAAVAWVEGFSDLRVKRWRGTDWKELRGSAPTWGVVAPVVALDRTGTPLVAWVGGITRTIHVVRWTGSDWEGWGGSENGLDIWGVYRNWLPGLSMAVDGEGNPVLAWAGSTGGAIQICVMRWTGSAWSGLGGSEGGAGISSTEGDSIDPVVVIDGFDRPVIAWRALPTAGLLDPIYIRRWDGARWAEIGEGSASGSGISGDAQDVFRPALALDGNGDPIVLWTRMGDGSVQVRKWNGQTWTSLGDGLLKAPQFDASLSVTAEGNPVVAWTETASGYRQIFVRQWDGDSWAEYGTGSATGGGVSNSSSHSSEPAIRVGGGAAFVVWVDQGIGGFPDVYVRRARAR